MKSPKDGEARGDTVPAADAEVFLERNRRVCLACGMELPKDFVVACGLQRRCPYCAHKYPLGDYRQAIQITFRPISRRYRACSNLTAATPV